MKKYIVNDTKIFVNKLIPPAGFIALAFFNMIFWREEYDYYLKDVHTDSLNRDTAETRLFEMSVRGAVKSALYYHKQTEVDFEDAFQEACIGIMVAIKKHNDNVMGKFT